MGKKIAVDIDLIAPLSSNAIKVYLMLSAAQGNTISIARDEIAKMCRLSTFSTSKALQELASAGMIKRNKLGGRKADLIYL